MRLLDPAKEYRVRIFWAILGSPNVNQKKLDKFGVVLHLPPGHLPPPFLWHLPPLFLWHLPPPTFVHLPPGQLPPLKFSRNETLTGCWSRVGKTTLFQSSPQNSYIISPKVFICHSGFGTCATGTSPSPYFVT